MHFLNVPGLYDSGEDHWQTIWETAYPQAFKRVRQKDWAAPHKNAWVTELDSCIKTYHSPLILVAHSLGCITVAHWANENAPGFVKAALLVAPADAEQSSRECFRTFCPIPHTKLPFPSIVVASNNDPYATTASIENLAVDWGSQFINTGNKGHINAQSGLGKWEEGLLLLQQLANNQLNYSTAQHPL